MDEEDAADPVSHCSGVRAGCCILSQGIMGNLAVLSESCCSFMHDSCSIFSRGKGVAGGMRANIDVEVLLFRIKAADDTWDADSAASE